MNKAQEYLKKFFFKKIKLEYNNKFDEYLLRGFVIFNINVQFIAYIVNDINFGDEDNNILKYDDLEYGYISKIEKLDENAIFKDAFV